MDEIQIYTRKDDQAGVTVMQIRGHIDTATSGHLEKELQRVLRARSFRIVIELSGVDYVSSAGWGIFLSEIRRIRQQGGDLRLAGMRPEVLEVYELLEFRSVLVHHADLAAALESFAAVSAAAGRDPDSAPGG
jgi:anti-sigma B factor antagonist